MADATRTPQGIEDVVVRGTGAPADWGDRIFSGGPMPPASERPPSRSRTAATKPTDPALARAMRALQR